MLRSLKPILRNTFSRLVLVMLLIILSLGAYHARGWIGQSLASRLIPATLSLNYTKGIPLGRRTVAIGGGGYVTGIYIHPKQQDLIYIRTDIGGFYRWDASQAAWVPLMEATPRQEKRFFGGQSLALDPDDPNVVYVAVGKGEWTGPGTVLKSTDRGNAWTKLNLDLPIAKEYRHWAGERLAVNPYAAKQLLFGSWENGLWRSTDAGATWQAVKSFPSRGNVSAIAFDPTQQGFVYAHLDGRGVYLSKDAGVTWTLLPNSPQGIMRMTVASNDTVYAVGYQKPVVTRYDQGTWQDITPPGEKPVFSAIAVNPSDPKDIVVSRGEKGSPKIYRSQDGGDRWQKLSYTTISTVPWWTPFMRKLAWVSSLAFDPHQSGRVWLTDWYGIWRSDDFNSKTITWKNYQTGHEEVVPFAMAAPPKGALLLSGVADVDGFIHEKGLDTYPSGQFGAAGPSFQDTYSIAYAESDPMQMVRVGSNRSVKGFGGATSRDGGLTWKAFKSFPQQKPPTRVAMSATNPKMMVVTRHRSPALHTTDGGASWQPVAGLPDGHKGPWAMPPQALVADKVDGNIFYYFHADTLYRSTDGGKSFQPTAAKLPNTTFWYTLQSTPGIKGDLWLALDDRGLFHSSNGGNRFDRITTVKEAHLLDLGKSKPGTTTPALYLYGTVVNQPEGVFRSLDQGKTWQRINDPKRPIGNEPIYLTASRQTYGLVFVSTNGRGIYYGSLE